MYFLLALHFLITGSLQGTVIFFFFFLNKISCQGQFQESIYFFQMQQIP